MNTKRSKSEIINVSGIEVDVIYKDIKNVHLSVHPPDGKVRIASPLRFDIDTLRVFVVSKLSWIKKQQKKFISQERESEREFIERESHYFLGKRYLLKVIESESQNKVEVKHNRIELHIKKNASKDKRKSVFEDWQRAMLYELAYPMLLKWEKELNVKAEEFSVRKMKTKWGTCSTETKSIRINLELVKKPLACIEYIVLHEVIHLLERRHNEIFIAYMDKHMPNWRIIKDELNKYPVIHSNWSY